MKMVCIKKGRWVGAASGKPLNRPAPQYGEIVTVTGREVMKDGRAALFLAEYNQTTRSGEPVKFLARHFRPLVADKAEATEKFDFRKQLRERV